MTGVQTCALPISQVRPELRHVLGDRDDLDLEAQQPGTEEGGQRRREIGEEVESGRLPVAFLDQRRGTLNSETDEIEEFVCDR